MLAPLRNQGIRDVLQDIGVVLRHLAKQLMRILNLRKGSSFFWFFIHRHSLFFVAKAVFCPPGGPAVSCIEGYSNSSA
jgi:hypothetical protein